MEWSKNGTCSFGPTSCWKELRQEWEKKSELPIDGLGKSGELIQTTLIRFLTSKADSKDSTGVNRLTEKEVKAIENGETNYYLMEEKGLQKRIYETAWEVHSYYMKSGNPEGNSAAQRLEFWKAAWHVIGKNWLFGVGTGDIVEEMKLAYSETGSYLSEEYRLKPHNQFSEHLDFLWSIWSGLLPFCFYAALLHGKGTFALPHFCHYRPDINVD